MGTSPTESGRIPPDTATGNSLLKGVMTTFIADGRPTAAMVMRNGTGIVLGGGGYYEGDVHVRGPDGPQGGRRFLCGRRWRWYGHEDNDVPVETIVATAGTAHGYLRPTFRARYGYRRRLCVECCNKWVRDELRQRLT